MDNEKILSLIYEWQNHILRISGIERDYENEIYKSIGSKPMKIITGFRRSGKSFLAQRIAKKLVNNEKFKLENVLYLNFEDFRLSDIQNAEDVNEIYELFLARVSKEGKKILIFDEIQNINNWDKFIRTIYEKNTDIEIILIGSNSEMLSSELGNNLAGRFIEFFIQPFSFKEFLNYNNFFINDENEFYRNQENINKSFYEYMKYGGLPEVFTIQEEKAKFSYLQGIVSKVILDDVIKRFKVRNVSIIEKLLNYLMMNVGNIISYARIHKFLENLSYELKQETIINYVEYFLKTFALFEVKKFDFKTSKIFETSKKYYSIDLGLVNLYAGLTNNFTSILENLIFCELMRKFESKNIFYSIEAQSQKEIDFVVEREKGIFDKYQVTQELNSNNQKRELDAFIFANKYMNRGENIILTLENDERVLDYEGVKILKKNIIRFLLNI